MRLAAGVGLDAMRQRVDAGGRGDLPRHGHREVGIDDGDIGQHEAALHRELVAAGRIGDERAGAGFAAGAGGGRHLHQRHAAAGNLLGARRCRQRSVIAGAEHGDQLGEIHRAAAAEADDEVGRDLARHRHRLFEIGQIRFGLDVAEHLDRSGQRQLSTRRALKGSEITSGRCAPIRSAKRAAAAIVPHPNSTQVGRSDFDRREGVGHCASALDRLWSYGGAAGQPLGIIDGLDQAVLVGDALAGDVEGGAVIDGGADDRQAERDVDAGKLLPAAGRGIDLEAEQLHRDVSLVVIHRDRRHRTGRRAA